MIYYFFRVWILCSRHCEPHGCTENICQAAWPRYSYKVVILITSLFNMSWILSTKYMMITSRMLVLAWHVSCGRFKLYALRGFHPWIILLGFVKISYSFHQSWYLQCIVFWHVGMHAYFLIPNFYSAIPWKLLEKERSWKMLYWSLEPLRTSLEASICLHAEV